MKKLDSKAGNFQLNMTAVRDLTAEEQQQTAGGTVCAWCTKTTSAAGSTILPGSLFIGYNFNVYTVYGY